MRGNKKLKFIDRFLGIFLCFLSGNLSKIFSISSERNEEIKKILIIKLAALGDTVLLVPAIRSIREKYQGCFISMVVTDINKEIIENCSYLDEIVEFPLKKCLKNPFKFVEFERKLQSKKFDIVVDFEQWTRISSLIAFFSGAKEKIGFKTDKQYRHYVYTKVVEHKKNQHEVECFLDIARALNCSCNNKDLELWIEKEDIEDVEKFLSSCGINASQEKFVVFHPGCGERGSPREWDKDNYVELGRKIIKEYGVKIIITGDDFEKEKCEYIKNKIGNDVFVFAGTPSASTRKLAEIFRRSSLVVCSNTGPMHVASALKTPVVALHGPTDPVRWGPWQNAEGIIVRKNLKCSPCLYLGFEYACDSYDCMKLITVADVFSSINIIISKILLYK